MSIWRWGLSQTYLGTTFENHEFWESLIFQLAPFTNLDFSFLNDLVDALQFLKYGSLYQRATQPKLALQDRDLGNLGKLIGEAEKIKKMHKVWKGLPIEDFSTQWQKTTFQIIQLRSAYSLSVEGNEMKNCVGGYAGSCREGRTSIWALVENSKGYFQRIANIEVTKQRVVRQIKAKANKPLGEDYMQIVWQWVGKEGLLVESNFSQ